MVKLLRISSFAFLLALFFLLSTITTQAVADEVRIGIPANRGAEQTLKSWQPTADYLSIRVPSHHFTIVPLDIKAMEQAVANGQLEFLVANPALYIEFEERFGITHLATLINRAGKWESARFGTVVFSRADRADITTLADLKGKSLLAVDEKSFGGWYIARYLLQQHGITPSDLKSLSFSGYPFDKVVMAVRNGEADAGTVRTDTLEQMAAEGMIDLKDFHILNPQQVAGFPFLLSSELYPEYAFARLRRTDPHLARQVAAQLLLLSYDSLAARTAHVGGWTIPDNYEDVRQVLKGLRLPPFQDYGVAALGEAAQQHQTAVVAAAAALLLALMVMFLFIRQKCFIERIKHLTALQESRMATEALIKSEESYSSLFENMLEGFAYCKMIYEDDRPRDFVYLSVNRAFETLTGLTNVVGKNVTEIIPRIRESNPELLEIYGRVALTCQPDKFETFVETLGIWFTVSVYSPEKGYFVAVFDNFTERKRAEEARKATIELLDICNKAGSSLELMRGLMHYFQLFTGCEAVGVRLRDGDDFPYYETRGFPEEFVLAENHLCSFDQTGELVRDSAGHPLLACMCGNILSGRFDPSRPFFTERGSFWSNNTTELLASTSEEERQSRTRNRCNGEGYESVALIPLRSQGQTFGLFQFNDRRPGQFSAEKIELLEDLVGSVAIALTKLKTDEALRESSQFNRQIIESAGEGVIVYGRDLRYQVWNPFMEQLSGLSASEVLGKRPLEVFSSLRDLEVVERLEMALAGQTPLPLDFPYNFPQSGRSGWVSDRSDPLRDTKGEIIGVINTLRDITDRKSAEDEVSKLNEELEQNVRQRTAQYEAVNKELEGFCYSVSHDLRAPIRHIDSFTRIFVDDYGASIPAEGKECLEKISRASKRMGSLIDALLSLSRITRGPISVEEINLTSMVQEIIAELTAAFPERQVTYSIAPELKVHGDPNMLQLVVENLIGNAWKYTGKKEHAEISCGAIETNGILTYFVRDNGAGFDMAYADKLFGVFQRLHSVSEYEGIGIGLATVKRIIQLHGGDIWAEAKVNEGATFYFTISQ